MRELRSPGEIALDVTSGLDTDADGRADTTLTDDGTDLVVATDLDRDGIADQVLRIGPDGMVREVVLAFPLVDDPPLDALLGDPDGG